MGEDLRAECFEGGWATGHVTSVLRGGHYLELAPALKETLFLGSRTSTGDYAVSLRTLLKKGKMAVQEVTSSVLEARYASDSETDDANMAASNVTQAQTLTKSEGGLHEAGARESDGKDYFSESDEEYDEESDLDAGTYLDQLSGEWKSRPPHR